MILLPSGYCPGCCDPCRPPTAELAAQEVCEGGTITLVPTVTGTGPLTYQWASRTGADPFVDIPGATSRDLEVIGATETTDYRVTVANGCGEAQAEGTLTVNVAPTITEQPAGGAPPILLQVAATGTAPLSYQWQEYDDAGAVWVNLAGETAPTYQADTPGEYRVIVSNLCGSEISEVAEVVAIPPSPFEGSGWDYIDAAWSEMFTDAAGTTPIAYTDGDSLRNVEGLGGTIASLRCATVDKFRYGTAAGARAINGLPVVYGDANNNAFDLRAHDAGGAQIAANAYITNKEFVFLALVRRRANDNNVHVAGIGSNAPGTLQQTTGNIQAFGFLSGFVTVSAAAAPGVLAIGWRFAGTDLQVRVLSAGGSDTGWQTVAQTAAWAADAGAIRAFIQANWDIQTLGMIDGDGGGDLAVTSLLQALAVRGGID